jgi:hypothetical protein
MKRWQLEQILYLNDVEKTKLALPDSHQLIGQGFQGRFLRKENIVLTSLRKCVSCLLKIF